MQTNSEVQTYFDRDYFEAGHKKGTRYADYLKNAMESTIYRGIGEAIVEVYRPRRVLEIGCAAGPIVRQLNDLGIEAHGIDISEWAVENRFHPNVIQASATDLPYETGSFDLVFSCHALEHLPTEIADAAFAEIGRVSGQYQFHMMPIIGIPPYHAPFEQALAGLRSDPTHNLLNTREWWIEQWQRHGWSPIPANILLDADNSSFEISSCQVLLSKQPNNDSLLRSIHEFNLTFFKRVSLWKLLGNTNRPNSSQPAKATHLGPNRLSSLLKLRSGTWGDLVYPVKTREDLRNASVVLTCLLKSDWPVKLRLAALSLKPGAKVQAFGQDEIEGVAQREFELNPGYSMLELPFDEFQLCYGTPRTDRVHALMVGGESARTADIEFSCVLKMPGTTGEVGIQLVERNASSR